MYFVIKLQASYEKPNYGALRMSRGTKTVNHPESHKKLENVTHLESLPHQDKLNQSIIQMLQTDGRTPFSEIANELGVSEGTIRNRVANMKKAGLLRIVAIVDPTASEYKSDAMIGIKVASGHSVESVSERLAEWQDVVYILWGEWPI